MSNNPDEAALYAAWAVLHTHGITEGLLGAVRLEHGGVALCFDDETTGYSEWVRLHVASLNDLSEVALREAAQRLVERMGITRPRHVARLRAFDNLSS